MPTHAFRYTPFYCEENVWHLAGEPALASPDARVVVISNDARACPVWHQRAGATGEPVWWDYHVVLAAGALVWDLDTTLGLPVPARRYLDETFAGAHALPPRLRPWFRLVAAAEFRTLFVTDRAHMRGPGGRWLAPPPAWAPPGSEPPGRPANLARFLDRTDPVAGEIVDLPGLRAALAPAGGLP